MRRVHGCTRAVVVQVVAHAFLKALLDDQLLFAMALLYVLLRLIHSPVDLRRRIGTICPQQAAPDLGPELPVAYTEEYGEGSAYRRENGKRSSQHRRLTR